MYDTSRMHVSERTQHTSKIRFQPTHGQCFVVVAKILVPVVRHDSNDLVIMSESSNELRDVSTPKTVFQDGDFIAYSFRIAGHIYALDCNDDF